MLGAREYWDELAGTVLLILVTLSAICADFAAGSPVVSSIPEAGLRRLLTGFIIAGAATAIVYSPLGRRSGGHFNPAITVAFMRLGKITRRSAAFCIIAQIAGAVIGAALVLAIWRSWAKGVSFGATVPGYGGAWAALAAEAASAFLLISLIVNFIDRPALMNFTPAAAGILLGLFVFAEAPVSGASLNPARTLGPDIVAGAYTGVWVYMLGPPLGALAAACLHRHRHRTVACGKLYHASIAACDFPGCEYTAPGPRKKTRPPMAGRSTRHGTTPAVRWQGRRRAADPAHHRNNQHHRGGTRK